MKRAKKLLAMILSLAMVMAMSATAFAEGTTGTPNAGNKTTATVKNVVSGATVTAYQIVSANYNSNGFLGYVRADGVTEEMLANVETPSSNEITAIAANKELLNTLKNKTMIAGSAGATGLADFTAELEAGYWVVVVTNSGEVVYNPMLVGVYYSVGGSNDTLVNQPVDATKSWSLNSAPAYAKSNTPTLDKVVTGSVRTDNNAGDIHDVAIDDIVKYQITATIPAYSATYQTVIVKITDQLSEGLTLQDEPVVSVNNASATKDTDYTYEAGTPANGYTISFNSAYALQHAGETVVVTYKAKLTDKAATNFDPNTNTAKFIYSNNPQDSASTNEIEKKTYTYTFEIDGNLYGNGSEEWNKVTEELFKGYKISTNETTVSWNTVNPLGGAKFSLTNTTTGKVYTTTTSDNGTMKFKGLDVGTYDLRETEAPAGYAINNTTIPVVISANYYDDGRLQDYTITINGENKSNYKATYDGEKKITNIKSTIDHTLDPDHDISDTYFFLNTTISTLPSTGGIGTTIFTIGGCIIMIIAAGLFFASRRKKAEN